MIHIYDMNGFIKDPWPAISLDQIASAVCFRSKAGGFYRRIKKINLIEDGMPVQAFCNADLDLKAVASPPLLRNALAKRRVGDAIPGPLWGTWVFVSGSDRFDD